MMRNNQKGDNLIFIFGNIYNLYTENSLFAYTYTDKIDIICHLVIDHTKIPIKMTREKRAPLKFYYDEEEPGRIEIGIDEAGRGPLFGRLYVAAVVLPKDTTVLEEWARRDIRDSKKYTSKKKIGEISKYIRETAFAFDVQFVEAYEIDAINIRQAVLLAMHRCAKNVLTAVRRHRPLLMADGPVPPEEPISPEEKFFLLLVDGCDFTPHIEWDEATESMREVPSVTVEGGDNTYMSIAAASILAKVARDEYIGELCAEHPYLVERYGLDTNMGYGTKKHMEGIRAFGITEWHRKSYGPCK